MKNLQLGRTEAEWLVDLLEGCDPAKEGTWRHDMAAEIRKVFGMCPFHKEKSIPAVKPESGVSEVPSPVLVSTNAQQLAAKRVRDDLDRALSAIVQPACEQRPKNR